MGPRTSPEALDAIAGKQTVIRQIFIPYSNLKIVRNVLSGLQLKKKKKEARTHRRRTSTVVIYIYIYIHKVKVKFSRYRSGVAQRLGRDIALLFHDRGTRRE